MVAHWYYPYSLNHWWDLLHIVSVSRQVYAPLYTSESEQCRIDRPCSVQSAIITVRVLCAWCQQILISVIWINW